MYKNALKEDFIRVVENLDGTVESTDTIVKLKTKIENSSTFESDPDFVKTLIQNCIDERVSRNEREVTLGKQKIELAKLQLAQLEKEVELQRVKNKALSLNPAAKVEDKQFKTLNKETATHIGIREAEDWFRPIDLAKECDIYISSRSGSHKEIPITYGYTQDPFKNRSQNFKPKIKENYPQYLERENKNCFICGDSSHYARDCEKRFKLKESNDHIHNKINVNTLKIESEKQNSDECANLQYILLWSPWKYRCGQRTVRMAVVACSQNQAVFARRRNELKLKQKLLDIRAELERERRTREEILNECHSETQQPSVANAREDRHVVNRLCKVVQHITDLESGTFEMLPRPPYAPDLTPIEIITSWVVERLSRHHSPATAVDKVWHRRKAAWKDLPLSIIQA
ncbi:hypothetical protein TNCV_3579301 [Trichonephila clavipes]|nr:hypothetical protein TNCV_3579301 [Trichonephila clavipes]